jgi:hypothetical protein
MTSATAHEIPAAASDQIDQIRALLDRTRAQFSQLATSSCERLMELFGLSAFELDIVLFCAAAELDIESADLCAAFHNDSRLAFPTFRAAVSLLPGADWRATLPVAPLRHWKLIEVAPGDLLMTSQLSLAEPVLHFLMGAPCIDAALQPLLQRVDSPRVLPSCYRPTVERLAALIARDEKPETIAQVGGDATLDGRQLAAAACGANGLRLYAFSPAQVASCTAMERENLQRLIERDAALCGFGLLIEAGDASPSERAAAAKLADNFAGVCVVRGNTSMELHQHRVEKLVVNRPGAADRHALWTVALGEDADGVSEQIDRLAAEFALDSETILRMGSTARRQVREGEESDLGDLLLESCHADARAALGGLTQHIEAKAGWADIVLPESSLEVLRAISAQVRQQRKVLETWGFAGQTARGLGISALFHGQSGTGKTLAAEILARDLRLDLFRIDLSQIVSKYIGETEKNLRTIFDAAENTGAVLLFDEADALFGKRSEVRDSHDRYANIEVSYLLQRVECYRGLAILTTNLRAALDTAFLRRISFFVNFPFPDQPLRRSIWQRMFPAAMPSEGLDFDKLSRLNLAGGNIRNIALHGAYIAADRGEPVRMEHLLIAARRECAKLERPLGAAETGGWV